MTGAVGSTVDVKVSLLNCINVDSTEFDINYDASAVAVVSITPGDVFPAQYTVSYSDKPGRIAIACARAIGFSGNGTVLTIQFKIISDVGSALTLTTHLPLSGDNSAQEVTWVDENYLQHKANVAIVNGGITVGDSALPAPVVTPWVPATPAPSPSPASTPAPTASSESSLPQETTSPEIVSAPTTTLTATAYYIGGGLLLAVVVLAAIVLRSRRKKGF